MKLRRVGTAHHVLSIALLLSLLGATSQPSKSIADYVKDLGDPTAEVREKARFELLGLSLGDLPQLKKIAADDRPLLPSQISALHDIVLHVVARDAILRAPKEANTAFMGVHVESDPLNNDPQRPKYVRIVSRLLGFNGYRYLADGDVIVKVHEFPGEEPAGAAFRLQVASLPPGSKLTMGILRQGKLITVAMPLDARPAAAAPGNNEQQLTMQIQEWTTAAEDYWRANFNLPE